MPTVSMVSGLDKMAAEEAILDDLEAIFLHSIPSLFRQAEQNLHSDNFKSILSAD